MASPPCPSASSTRPAPGAAGAAADEDDLSSLSLLRDKLRLLEARLEAQEELHTREILRFEQELSGLRSLASQLEEQNASLERSCRAAAENHYTRRVEWTIAEYSHKSRGLARGESIWSPRFRAAGLEDLQLEFFPVGREKTTLEGFCSLFLWSSGGTTLKYQLWVGSHRKPPDRDVFAMRVGRGHTNFCPVAGELDAEKDRLVVGVDILDAVRMVDTSTLAAPGLRLTTLPLERLISREMEVVENRAVAKVIWKLAAVSQALAQFPRGSSLWSRTFTAGGVRDLALEFYPNGNANTTKDGFCALYLRCPAGAVLLVTLVVGSVKRGPIKVAFEGLSGQGMPNFCQVQGEINRDEDSIALGLELDSPPNKTLILEPI